MGDKVNKKLKLVEETLEALIKNSNLVYCVKYFNTYFAVYFDS